MPYQSPRGTNDVLPYDASRSERTFDSHVWRWVEDTFAQLSNQFGYSEIRTPIFEDTELFTRTSGDTSEIVTKQMYSFLDKGDRSISLKPEGTAPVMRAYLQHNLGASGGPTRLWYFTHIFRYERPQRGRYRQAHQVGAELIGTDSPAADAEMIELAYRFYERLGVRGLKVSLNSIGRTETRVAYRDALLKHMESYLADQGTEARAQAERNPLRMLDSKDPAMRAALQGAPSVLDYLESESAANFAQVQSLLTEAGVPYAVTPEIVRGLDYYTDTVFEVQSTNLGAQTALCGGGRYDNLIKEIGGPATPSVGFGAGVERVIIVMESQGLLPEAPRPDYYVVCASAEAEAKVRELVRSLRATGAACGTDIQGRSLRAQFKAADRSGAKRALILGEDELAGGTLTVKDLGAGTQETVNYNDFLSDVARA